MLDVDSLETMSQLSCGFSILGFMFIASASRSEKLESMVQWFVVLSSICAAVFLILLWNAGGGMWGSQAMVRPLAVLSILIAIAARLNLKGAQISQGMNPHEIMKESADLSEAVSVSQDE